MSAPSQLVVARQAIFDAAEQLASALSHELAEPIRNPRGETWTAECQRCGSWINVQVPSHLVADPNEQDDPITGRVVRMACPGRV